MGLSVNARAFLWGDGLAVSGQDLRLQMTAALLASTMPNGSTGIAARAGVRPSGPPSADSLAVKASSGMNITVNAGMAFVQGSTAANSGIYTVDLDTTSTITVATADPTNPRIDNVIVQVTDLGTSGSTAVITLQTGTPAPSPSAPALPANSLLLATVAVAANTTTIVSGNITDGRQFTVAQGGIVPVSSLAPGAAMVATNGQYAHEYSTGRLRVGDGFGFARQPKIAAFGAVTATGSGTAAVGSFSTIATTASITTDGSTEVMIYASWGSLTPGSGTATGDFCNLAIYMDGAGGLGPSAITVVKAESTNLNATDGGNLQAWVTPGSGTHTFSLVAESTGHAFTVNSGFIRVAPSLQQ